MPQLSNMEGFNFIEPGGGEWESMNKTLTRMRFSKLWENQHPNPQE